MSAMVLVFLSFFIPYNYSDKVILSYLNIERGNCFFFTSPNFLVLNLVNLTILYEKRLI